jgi:hypothetical protein
MLSKREMLLIEAEVYMRRGDFATMTQKLNVLRGTVAGLSPRTVPATAAGAQTALLEERFAELFVEGHRLHDLYRFNLVPAILGANRRPSCRCRGMRSSTTRIWEKEAGRARPSRNQSRAAPGVKRWLR